ncbi:MAG: phosphoesterase PA-phosphatase, partial [Halohasta sp.]
MLRAILLEVTAVVASLCVVSAVTLVGPSRLAALRTELEPRLRESAPYLAVLVVVLVLNSIIRDSAQQLSWKIGFEITYLLARYDAGIVDTIQSFQSGPLTLYFSSVYVYGYVFLLVFPIVAYVALSDRKPFQRLVVAYSLNYFVGLLLYVLFIAYGPRNWWGEVGTDPIVY